MVVLGFVSFVLLNVKPVLLVPSVLNVSLEIILKLINLVLIAQLTVLNVLLKLPMELKLVTVPLVTIPEP
jgi:hypothetical protein